MSELIVSCFGDKYRASQVIHDLRRMNPTFVADLDNAVALLWDEEGNMRVQQSIDPTSATGAAWSSLWGAFISVAFLVPYTEGMPAAASALVMSASSPASSKAAVETLRLSPTWWIDEFHIPDDYLRDVGAMVQPGGSAVIVAAMANKPQVLIKQLRQQGGTVMHLALTDDQVKQLHIALTALSAP